MRRHCPRQQRGSTRGRSHVRATVPRPEQAVLREALDQLPHAVIVLPAGTAGPVLANRAFREQLSEDAAGFLHAHEALRRGLDAADEGRHSAVEFEVHNGQEQRVMRATISPLAGDGAAGVMVQCFDATEVDRQGKARDRALSLLAHELQSPLTVIKGYAEQLRWAQEHDQPLLLDESLEAILRQATRLRALIRDVLEHAAADLDHLALDWNEVALSELLDEVLNDCRVAYCREIWRDVTPGLRVRGDAQRLEQVMRNLLENAVKYSPTSAPVQVTLQARGSDVELAIRDYGDGITEEDIAHLFDPFYRTATARHRQPKGGFGLGLALCHQLVLRHHGNLTVKSEPGAGSTFFVSLPALA